MAIERTIHCVANATHTAIGLWVAVSVRSLLLRKGGICSNENP